MPTIADDFLLLHAGDMQPDGGRLYGTIIDDLLASDVDLIFLETGFTSRVNGTLGQTFLSQDQIQLLQDADTDGDGTRHVFGYVNLAITDHYRTYWIDRWTLDETGAPFTVFDPGSNQDVLQLNPDGDVPGWLVNTLGIATAPPPKRDRPRKQFMGASSTTAMARWRFHPQVNWLPHPKGHGGTSCWTRSRSSIPQASEISFWTMWRAIMRQMVRLPLPQT